MKRSILLLFPLFFIALSLSAQSGGVVRGNIYDKETGEPVMFGNVILEGTTYGANTDLDGFFSIGNVAPGEYKLVATYIGYDSINVMVKVKKGGIVYETIKLAPNAVKLTQVDVSARREQARSDVQVSKVRVTPQQIRSLPATGGEADIAQYLPVLPGIISTGDQGGQLYIRGGSPVQNKILLDGVTIYNPFHSIGFFSVFETETIKSVDVYTGGFNAEYGSRISAIVDIKTREGNKKKLSGLVSASPFQAKALLEGPIVPIKEDGAGSVSFILTGKHSYLDESSKIFYDYAVDTTFFSFAETDTELNPEDIGLPFAYTDLYGKVSFVGNNGSKLDLFGFNFRDRFNFIGLSRLDWTTSGGGANFKVIPPNSNLIMDGSITVSSYELGLEETDARPRTSGINSYSALLTFTYFGNKNQVNYGFDFTGFDTQFEFSNFVGTTIEQNSFTTELAAYIKYKHIIGDFIIVHAGLNPLRDVTAQLDEDLFWIRDEYR